MRVRTVTFSIIAFNGERLWTYSKAAFLTSRRYIHIMHYRIVAINAKIQSLVERLQIEFLIITARHILWSQYHLLIKACVVVLNYCHSSIAPPCCSLAGCESQSKPGHMTIYHCKWPAYVDGRKRENISFWNIVLLLHRHTDVLYSLVVTQLEFGW